jgi:hypothetical protein
MDPDNDTVTFLRMVDPPNGTLERRDDGSFVYRSGRDSKGRDSFTYEVQDSFGAKATGIVLIGIAARNPQNTLPIAVPDRVSLRPGDERSLPVLRNDIDLDGDELSIDPELGVPREGTARVEGDAIVFTAGPTAGVVSFDYGVVDERGGRDRGLVTVTVRTDAPPRPLIAVDDATAPVTPGTPVDIDVLANDSDPDGDVRALTISLRGDPPPAEVVGGKVRVVAATEPMVLVYTITDPARPGRSASAIIRVPVQAAVDLPPRVAPDETTTPFETAVELDVLGNDSDPEGKSLQLVRTLDSRGGTATVKGDRVEFVPSAGHSGDAGFAYEVSDGVNTATGTARVTVEAKENQVPSMTSLELEVPSGGQARTVDLSAAITDPDPDDRPRPTNVTGQGNGVSASLEGSVLRASADANRKGTSVVLTVTIDDGRGGTAQGIVTVRVIGSDRPAPIAVDDEDTGNQDAPWSIDLVANDTDPLGRGLTVFATTPPLNGSVQIEANGRSVLYTPTANFFGTTSFTYTVRDAENDPERESTATVRITVRGKPSAPLAPTCTRDNRAVDLAWSAPPMNGGEFLRYEVATEPEAGAPRSAPSTSFRYDGLTNGQEYRFKVRAVNVAGEGPWSSPSNRCTPNAAPGIPAAPTLVFGDGQLTVNWTRPTNEGTEITNYDILLNPGARLIPAGSGLTYTVTGLANGTAYTARIRATNDGGTSEYGPPSASETPCGAPAMMGAPTIDNGDTQATITWTPATPNGCAVQEYRVSVASRTIAHTNLASLQEVVTGLTNGTDYTATVAARNRFGWSAESAGAPVRTYGVPAQPTGLSATAGVREALLQWTTPANNGNPISRFVITATGGVGGSYTMNVSNPGQGSAQSYNWPNLPNGSSTNFVVRACNARDCGVDSAVATANTPDVPSAPTITGVSDRAAPSYIDISWSVPADNGRPITGYELLINGGAISVGNATTYRHNGLNYGQSFTYQVRARNAVGVGNLSNAVVGRTQDPPQPTWTVTVDVNPGNHEYTTPNPSGPADGRTGTFHPNGTTLTITCRTRGSNPNTWPNNPWSMTGNNDMWFRLQNGLWFFAGSTNRYQWNATNDIATC